MFAEKYIGALSSSDLRDDEFHHATEPLHAAATADRRGGALLGSLLSRVKYADGTVHKTFESGTANLASLIGIWGALVAERGRARQWMPTKTAWDMQASFTLYDRVAKMSLGYWLDGRCIPCGGSGVMPTLRKCSCCAGSGKATIEGGRFESELVRDMVSELEGILQAHNARAAGLLRRAA